MSDASISSLRWKISMPSGIGKHFAAIHFRKVDFPQPFLPTKPYLQSQREGEGEREREEEEEERKG
jgi:hypothetical protein